MKTKSLPRAKRFGKSFANYYEKIDMLFNNFEKQI